MASEEVEISDSILTSIKKQLNIDSSETGFDSDIVFLINSALGVLNQLGVGPSDGFSISGEDETWDMFITEDRLNMAFHEVFIRVKMSFDPPNGSMLTSLDNVLKELDWRLTVAAEEVSRDE